MSRRDNSQATLAPSPLPPDRRQPPGLYSSKAVGAFLPKLTAAAFERYGFHSAEIMTAWPTIVGEDLAKVTSPVEILWPRTAKTARAKSGEAAIQEDARREQGARLILRVEPAVALEISYRTGEIVDRVNQYFGYRAICDVRVMQVPGTAKAVTSGRRGPAAEAKRAAVNVSSDNLDAALQALGKTIGADA